MKPVPTAESLNQLPAIREQRTGLEGELARPSTAEDPLTTRSGMVESFFSSVRFAPARREQHFHAVDRQPANLAFAGEHVEPRRDDVVRRGRTERCPSRERFASLKRTRAGHQAPRGIGDRQRFEAADPPRAFEQPGERNQRIVAPRLPSLGGFAG